MTINYLLVRFSYIMYSFNKLKLKGVTNKSMNIKSKLYPDLRHEILNEKEYEQIYEDVLEFFKQ